MTQDQMAACIELDKQGFKSVTIPGEAIPGPILMADPTGTRLLLVQPDGSTVDLLALHRAAEDLIRNWGKGTTVPKFIGDWRRLILVANVLNGGDPDALREPK